MDQSIINTTRRVALYAALIGCPSFAAAAVLPVPDATFFYDEPNESSTTFSSTPFNLTTSTSSVSATGMPDPVVKASETNYPGEVGLDVFDSGINYYFEVSGPSGGSSQVQIEISAALTATGSGTNFVAYSIINLYNETDTSSDLGDAADACDSGFNDTCGTSTVNVDALISVDTIYEIGLLAQVTDDSNSSSFASVDPSIYIDPSFPDANQYSITVSAGIGNPLPVPEPATLALFCTGLVGFYAVRRRKSCGRRK